MPSSSFAPLRVLVVQHPSIDRRMLDALRNVAPVLVPDAPAALMEAVSGEPCVAIVVGATPGAQGALGLLRGLREMGRRTAVVVVVEPGEEDVAGLVLREGAAACIRQRAGAEYVLSAVVSGLARLAGDGGDAAPSENGREARPSPSDPMLALHLKAEEAARLKAEIVANVSHELRTPLTSVLGYADILQDSLPRRDGEDAQEILRRLREQAERLHDVVASVVTLGRLRAATDGVTPAVFPLAGLLEELRADALVLNFEKKLTMHWCGPAEPCDVLHDREKIRTIGYHLLSNAIKFTHAGQIDVELTPTETGGIRLCVRDTGIGLPEEGRAVIFEDFRQLDGSTTRRYEGLGIGLGLVRRYTALLRGTLDVTSAPGAGTTFTIDIPPPTQ